MGGADRYGGRSRELSLRCTSISETSNAGAMADTGTLPDSAPQMPLKTDILSEVDTIFAKLDDERTKKAGAPGHDDTFIFPE